MADTYDTVVVGAGIVGSFAAYHLCKTGKSVILLEQFPLPHTRGSSHGQTRGFRLAYGEKGYYTKMASEAIKQWKLLEKESGMTLYKKTGLVSIGSGTDNFVEATVKSLRKVSAPVETLESEQLKARYPMFLCGPTARGIFDGNGGILRADQSLKAVQQMILEFGGHIQYSEKARDIIPGKIITITTDKGSYRARNVVVTAGPWSCAILNKLGLSLPLKTLRTNVCYWREKEEDNYSSNSFPIFSQYNAIRGMLIYGVPSYEYRGLMKVCVHGGVEIDPNKRDSVDDTEFIEDLKEYVRKHLPGLIPDPAVIESCIYTMTPDEDYILDVHPAWDNIVIGAGFSGHGFKLAPVSGQILAELVTKSKSSFDISHFRISRFHKPKL